MDGIHVQDLPYQQRADKHVRYLMIRLIKQITSETKGAYISFFIYALLIISMLAKLSQSGSSLWSLNNILIFALISWSIIVMRGYYLSKSWAWESIIILNIAFVVLTIFVPLILYMVFIGPSEPDFFMLYFNSLNLFLLLLGTGLVWATYLLTRSKEK